jgi:serine/threonine protein kinase
MSAVYRARHVRTNRTVAVKVLSPGLTTDEEYRARFLEEAQRASRVDEPHIIDVYDADEEAGRLYLAMRFVEGGDLSSLLRRDGPLPPDRAVRLIEQVASALDAAHGQGLVHRDVKPGNILIGPNEHIYLSDFGVAKAQTGRALTQTGMFIGSPDYASPEQWEGQRDVDGRADQYALAGVFHECLTGARPYERDSMTGLMYAHLQLPPPHITEVRPDLPRGLDAVIIRAMAKDRTARFPSCGDFALAARGAVAAGSAPETQVAGPSTILAGGQTVASAPTPAPAPPPVSSPTQLSSTPEAPTPVHEPTPPPHSPVPPAPSGGRKGWLIGGVAALALLAVAGVIAAVLLTRGDDEPNAATTQRTTQTTATTGTATVDGSAAFSDPPNLFRAVERDGSNAMFSNAAYAFFVNAANQPLISVADREAPADVRITVDVTGGGSSDFGASVLCRYQGSGDYYLLAIASDGRYNVVKYAGGEPGSLQGGFKTSSAVQPDGATNHVEATCQGSDPVDLTLVVNGTRVARITDSDSPHTGGTVGLRVGTTEPPVSIQFENFVMAAA